MSLNIIPLPNHLRVQPGSFLLRTGMRITAQEFMKSMAIKLQTIVNNSVKIDLKITDGIGEIRLCMADPGVYPDEGYRLEINVSGIVIEASTEEGLFYAVQTLQQTLPVNAQGEVKLPCVEIEDSPRFKWRGLHLDVCRHFFDIDFVKRYIDWMAMHKYNVFHWHLTEDQGWRFEVPDFSGLSDVSAWRHETGGDRYGGYYTQAEIREVLQYAREKFVRVVPEIELPGHAQAALAAYPEYSCTGGPFEVVSEWGVFDEVFCAGNDATFQFLEQVFEQVVDLFPDDYVHIGGDECPKKRWKECTKCQKRMRDEGLANEEELQSYFVRHFASWLSNRGKRPIGWDEILEGGLPETATVMSWRGEEGGLLAAQAGHDVVMAPETHVYFDRRHYDREGERGRLSVNELSHVYSYEPIPKNLEADLSHRILGVEGTMWTEGTETPEEVAYMLYPRACALAEVAWSSKSKRNWENFRRRLRQHDSRLTRAGIGYYPDHQIWD